MQTNNQKKESAGKHFFVFGKIWEVFLFFVTTTVFLTVLAALGFKIFFLSETILVSTLECVDSKIEQEQMTYHADALKILEEIEKDVWLVDQRMMVLEQGEELSVEEKKQLNRDLKKIEESSILLEGNFDKYFDDFSIQVYSRSNEEITSFIYETRNFSITLNRFVRMFELGLFLNEEFNEDQTALILDNYYDVLWYLDQFGLLK